MNKFNKAKNYFEQAVKLCEEEKYQEALPLYGQAIALQPESPVPFYNRAKAYYKLGKFEKAIEDYTEAIRQAPQTAEFYNARSITYHQLGKQSECLADMDKAVSLEPQNPYHYSCRAFLKARIGMVMSAMEDYQKTLELDPEDAIAYNNLGMLQEQLGYKGFKENYEKADQLTGGRTAPQTDVKKVVAEYEAKKAQEQPAQTNAETDPKGAAGTKPKLSSAQYFRTLRELLTSRKTQAEFWDFLRRK